MKKNAHVSLLLEGDKLRRRVRWMLIDIGTYDQELFPLLMQHEGLIKVLVINERSDLDFPINQQYIKV